MSKVVISQVDEDAALAFWSAQDNARIFLHPQVLTPLCARVDWWLATWDNKPACLWPVCHGFDGRHVPPDLSAYVGPLWHDSVGARKAHRWWTITQDVQRALLGFLIDRYRNFVFELPPGTRDVRVLQWMASEAASSANIVIECRHTAVSMRPSASLEAGLTASFSRNRLRDIRNAQALGYREWLDPDPDALFKLYFDLLGAKEDEAKARRRKHQVLLLIELAKAGFGRVIAYRDVDGLPASFALILTTKRTALPLLLASSNIARREGVQAILLVQSMLRSFEDGVDSFDFAGANSMIGAEEKHRYGAWPEMYFRVAVESK